MQTLCEKNVFKPEDLRILASALRSASVEFEDRYGLEGTKLATAQTIAADAIFQQASSGDIEPDGLLEAATESVRQFLSRVCRA